MATASAAARQYALPPSGGPQILAPSGRPPQAIVAHHTSGGPKETVAGIVNWWRSQGKGEGTQYIMDREGVIHDVAKEFGYTGTGHVHPKFTPQEMKDRGLLNKNLVGMEIMAANDKGVSPLQSQKFAEWAATNFPETEILGHGELNPIQNHREKTEGVTARDAAMIAQAEALDARTALAEAQGKVQSADTVMASTEAPAPNVASAANQYALPAAYTPDDAGASATAQANQYALPQPGSTALPTAGSDTASLPQGTDPMTAGNAPSQSSIRLPESFNTPEVQAVMQNVANRQGIATPEAIAGVIKTESNFNPAAGTGSYKGLTQIGPDTFKEAGGKLGGLTWQEYQQASPVQQIGAYGDWLKHYGFTDKIQAFGNDFSQMSPAEQSAYLQGFQFAPNATAWQSAYGQGKDTLPTTATKQANVLGDKSMQAMTDYYEKVHGAGWEPGKGVETAKAPAADIAKGFEQAAGGASGGSGGGIGSDAARAPEKQWALPKSPEKALADAAKAFEPKDEKSAVQQSKDEANKSPLGALGEGLGALGDARMQARMQAIAGMPLAGTPPENMPAPATPEPAPTPVTPPNLPSTMPGGADYVPPTVEKAAPLPDPGPLVPQINVPPVNEGANQQLADAFGGGGTPSWVPDTTPQNLFGETPNLTGSGPGSILPAQPQQMPTALADPFAGFGSSPIGPLADAGTYGGGSAGASIPWIGDTTPADLYGGTPNLMGTGSSGFSGDPRSELATVMHEQQNNDLEINPSAMQSPGSLADASSGGGGVANPTTYSGGPVGPGQVADSNWGIIVPPVHTPLPGPETMNYGNFIQPSTWAIINAPGVGLG